MLYIQRRGDRPLQLSFRRNTNTTRQTISVSQYPPFLREHTKYKHRHSNTKNNQTNSFRLSVSTFPPITHNIQTRINPSSAGDCKQQFRLSRFRRGALAFGYGHSTENPPVLVRSPKSSSVARGQYLDGRPPSYLSRLDSHCRNALMLGVASKSLNLPVCYDPTTWRP